MYTAALQGVGFVQKDQSPYRSTTQQTINNGKDIRSEEVLAVGCISTDFDLLRKSLKSSVFSNLAFLYSKRLWSTLVCNLV